MFDEMTRISSFYVYVNKLECLSSGDKKFYEMTRLECMSFEILQVQAKGFLR